MNIHKCLYLGMPSSHPFSSFDPLEWEKLLESQAVVLPETKNQPGRTFDETCCVHICVCKKGKKLEKQWWRRWQQAEKARPKTDNEKSHFSLCLFDCELQNALVVLVFLSKHETWSSFLLNSCQIWVLERAALWWSAPRGT